MAEIIRMPRMSDTMTEGVLVSWQVKIGDKISPGDVMAEVETDKATMELESYQEGVLLYMGVKEGESVPVEGVLAIIGEKGEDYKPVLEAEAAAPKVAATEETAAPPPPMSKHNTATPPPPPPPAPAPVPVAAAPAVASNGRVKASPLAKRLALESGIDISAVRGTGEDGRIVKRDVEAFVAGGGASAQPASSGKAAAPIALPTIVAEESFEEVGLSQMRKTIARRLGESKFSAPHFYLNVEINMDKIVAARKQINEYSPVKISFNDVVVKAAAIALRSHPAVNGSWLGDRIRYNKHVNIGVAVAVDEGLLVPVIKFADNKTLSHISAETRELAGKAKTKKLGMDEMTGNTFTISNLGMFGIEEFTAIINPPDACIMAVGTITRVPRVVGDEIKPVNVMKVTLSCDHRVVDGAKGAAFLKTFRELLEEPMRLLV